MPEHAVLFTRALPEAVERRASRDYRLIANPEDRKLSAEEIVARSQEVDAVVCTVADRMDAGVLSRLSPRVRIVASFGVGTEHLDLAAAKARGLVVSNTPEVLTDATAEVALLLLLGAARRAYEGQELLRSGGWTGWGPTQLMGRQLSGKRLGIVGMGRIGQAVARRVRGFGVELHYTDQRRLPPEREEGATFHPTVEALLPLSELLSLHAPSTPETRHLLDARRLALLPRGAIVVNTARGDLVDDEALVAALRSGQVGAAGLDVFQGEPALHPAYRGLPNTFLLPHMGSATIETREAMGFRALDNVDAVLSGQARPRPGGLTTRGRLHPGVAHLFDPLLLRSVTLPNRVGVSPMCEYSADDGFANDWHLVHLGSRAVGGAGLVTAEATAVEARGRITARDLGLWKDAHIETLARMVRFLESQGAVAGVQLAHAGRKASTRVPWEGGAGVAPAEGGWEPIAPSPIAFSERTLLPKAMSLDDIGEVTRAFAAATRRAQTAGFRLIELHFAHGYLVHSFLSPLSNRREDAYGGGFEQRIRLALDVTRAVRAEWPDRLPLLVRLSCTDWVEGGWTLEESVELARRLAAEGVDLVDCSSGGLVPYARIEPVPGYQVPFARRIRAEARVPTAAVGLISTPGQAQAIVEGGDADMVMLARAMLRDPYWPLHAAAELGRPEGRRIPVQYLRAF